MKAIGAGVQEIRIRVAEGQFRILYVVVKADAVYVLHAFQKKGQKTSKQDIELTRKRLKALNL